MKTVNARPAALLLVAFGLAVPRLTLIANKRHRV